MNELKQEDVMKALECCSVYENCDGCPHFDGVPEDDCHYKVMANALSLLREKDATLEMCAETIERQDKELAKKDAEIERLTVNMNAFGLTAKNFAEENERLTAQIENCDACDRIGLTASEHKACIKQAQAEAITAFVDGCVKMAIGLGGIPVVCLESIFQFAKKMKEEKDGESDL